MEKEVHHVQRSFVLPFCHHHHSAFPSDGIPLSFCEQIYFVCSRRSVAALQTKCDLYRDMNQLLKGRGAGGQQLIVFFPSFLRWPFSTIEGKAEGAGFSLRLPLLNSAHTQSCPALALSDGGAVSYKETMTKDAGKRRVDAHHVHIASYIHAKASLKLCAIIFCQAACISGKGSGLVAAHTTYRR